MGIPRDHFELALDIVERDPHQKVPQHSKPHRHHLPIPYQYETRSSDFGHRYSNPHRPQRNLKASIELPPVVSAAPFVAVAMERRLAISVAGGRLRQAFS